ncbi:MAG: DUF2442 domain-containing protein [Candidatus Symbiothrix sp.]|jgi:hypothetical protein|nr:DUF2442 domain-containing protein [Candidatus Symbiothrix sp.]
MKITTVWFDNDKIFIRTDDGQELWQSLLWYPRLRYATKKQRMEYEFDDDSIRWEELDEDVSLESFLYDDPEPIGVAKFFHQYSELNASAIARRMGIQQSLWTAYVNGTKTPSKKRVKEIEKTVRDFGKELSAIEL